MKPRLPVYFWKNSKVHVVVEEEESPYDSYLSYIGNLGFLGCACCDACFEGKGLRYGLYLEGTGWNSIDYEDLPAEFKTHLLLLGVNR